MHTWLLLAALGAALAVQGAARASARDAAACPSAVDVHARAVFDWRFYVNSYDDLRRAGITSEALARAHWNTSGLGQGRWASPLFHTTQYLHLNRAAVRAACASASEQGSVEEALRHYLGAGRAAGLAPLTGGAWSYAAGDAGWRYAAERVGGAAASARRVDDATVRVSAASRYAGAVDSLSWRGAEYLVTASRRGALHVEVERRGDACTRCSEAGARADAQNGVVSARLDSFKTAGELVETRTTPAYWLGAGERTPECPAGRDTAGLGGGDDDDGPAYLPPTCPHSVHKRVALVDASTVRVDADVTLGDDGAGETRVALVAHLADDLVLVHGEDGASAPLGDGREEADGGALVLVSAANGRALGVWAPCATALRVAPSVDGPTQSERAVALRVVRDGALGRRARLTLYLVVGERDDVVARLATLRATPLAWQDGAAPATCLAPARRLHAVAGAEADAAPFVDGGDAASAAAPGWVERFARPSAHRAARLAGFAALFFLACGVVVYAAQAWLHARARAPLAQGRAAGAFSFGA